MAEEKKNWIAYGLLICFGAYGIHRFYLDKWMTGIVYACTGGIFGIGILYDIFAIPFHVHAANRR